MTTGDLSVTGEQLREPADDVIVHNSQLVEAIKIVRAGAVQAEQMLAASGVQIAQMNRTHQIGQKLTDLSRNLSSTQKNTK
ncbi:hypothetical protein LIT25_18830 [Bacillus sp. F19]|nr:hypothetical protein LIT25_18830 [Bacillus sp. F19]